MIEALELLAIWAGHVNSGRVKEVIGMYSETATLLPTFASNFANTKEAIAAYFEKLGGKTGLKVTFNEASIESAQLGDSSFVAAGFYAFEHEVDGVQTDFQSRFTFVFDTSKESPIVHHHSSQLP